MPRAKKTMAGVPGQKVEAVQGQTYGEGARQEALQRSMPAPQQPAMAAPTVPQQQTVRTSEQSGPPPEPAQPRMTPEQAMQLIAGRGNLLRQPDDNPNIPVTDGLSRGPGRGPETLQRSSALGDTLRKLAMQTSDPVFLELANKVKF